MFKITNGQSVWIFSFHCHSNGLYPSSLPFDLLILCPPLYKISIFLDITLSISSILKKKCHVVKYVIFWSYFEFTHDRSRHLCFLFLYIHCIAFHLKLLFNLCNFLILDIWNYVVFHGFIINVIVVIITIIIIISTTTIIIIIIILTLMISRWIRLWYLLCLLHVGVGHFSKTDSFT